jgi:hypothetical protein
VQQGLFSESALGRLDRADQLPALRDADYALVLYSSVHDRIDNPADAGLVYADTIQQTGLLTLIDVVRDLFYVVADLLDDGEVAILLEVEKA